MGGTDHDMPLHERQSAAVADRTAPINPDLSLILPLCLRARVLGILQKYFAILRTATTPVITPLLQAGKQSHREAGERKKLFHPLWETPKCQPWPLAGKVWRDYSTGCKGRP